MPYNTSAIPPRMEPTGHTQLPLSRVKKIISQDSDIAMCSNNAAFIITCATEMFIQHISDAAHTQAKLERKPRRNIQYKDVATAVSHQDNLEFLEDIIPKTVPFRKIKATARETQARLRGEKPIDELLPASSRAAAAAAPLVNGAAAATAADAPIVNGEASALRVPHHADDGDDGPSNQLELEMRQAERVGPSGDPDVNMSG
ncbi:histone-like transcription factor (CBF/NF-Y) and archaeal histone domain-containing protein [Hirsutella rhossiliensis]|uniref:Histone-like transcription factor (CBF/NF-Y) and archaeal histone domain-containing protein n=1 Tax=Hirsutella rhossiliensis TaxID=111463 RepID=A0A9P8N2A5_9HYPO|nr:histone-like transcription factor (CBF/NF-Y) and archaeal histone domain-containing protein [Hirsutella rhossiliensis]KAH0964544.1 histone-like transcription factor (CBF/NF-Y) and archaeal histone domain-containing protein [Hirsutella rhossiliensis]